MWILIMTIVWGHTASTTVIPNFLTQAECNAASNRLYATHANTTWISPDNLVFTCIQQQQPQPKEQVQESTQKKSKK